VSSGTSIETLVAVEGHRWAIEDSFEDRPRTSSARSQREQILAWLASPRSMVMLALRHVRRSAIAPIRPVKKTAAEQRQKPKHRHAVIDPLVNPEVSRIAINSLESEFQPHISLHGHSGAELYQPRQRAHFKAKRQL